MSTTNQKTCRLCLDPICGKDFDTIHEETKNMLDVLCLKLDLEISIDPIMCNDCAKNLQKSFLFKLECLIMNNKLSFKHSTKKGHKNCKDVCKTDKICKICLKTPNEDSLITLCESKESVLVFDVLKTHLPQLYLNISEQVLICTGCLESLQELLRFVKNCMDVEEKIHKYVNDNQSDSKGQIELSDIQRFTLKMPINVENGMGNGTEGILEIREEEITVKEVEDCIVIDGDDDEMDIEQTNSNNKRYTEWFPSRILRYKCNRCSFVSQSLRGIKAHTLRHKKETVYKCAVCTYETKHKDYINTHMFLHNNFSKAELFEAGLCSFETAFESNPGRHVQEIFTRPKAQVNHNINPEEIMFRCLSCFFKAKRNDEVKEHMLLHKPLDGEAIEAVATHQKRQCQPNIIRNFSFIKKKLNMKEFIYN